MERDAASLRALVRLSLCDAADLALARRVLGDAQRSDPWPHDLHIS